MQYNFARIFSPDICTALQWGCRYPLNPYLQSTKISRKRQICKILVKSERKCRCDPSTNCRSALVAGSPTQGQLFNTHQRWEKVGKEQKICRRTRVFFCCCKKALLHKKQQQRTCTKTRAAALHWRDRITRALRGDRAADGGHYKASAWKQCKKQ